MEYHGKKTEVFLESELTLYAIGGKNNYEKLIYLNDGLLVGYTYGDPVYGNFRYYFDSVENMTKFMVQYL